MAYELDILTATEARTDIPDFASGDTVRVHAKVIEGDKERIQVLQGLVIRQRRNGVGATFTVRKVSYSVGVERIFPAFSPRIDKVEIVSRGIVRRSKLYYLRGLEGKAARLKDARDKVGAQNQSAAAAAKAQA